MPSDVDPAQPARSADVDSVWLLKMLASSANFLRTHLPKVDAELSLDHILWAVDHKYLVSTAAARARVQEVVRDPDTRVEVEFAWQRSFGGADEPYPTTMVRWKSAGPNPVRIVARFTGGFDPDALLRLNDMAAEADDFRFFLDPLFATPAMAPGAGSVMDQFAASISAAAELQFATVDVKDYEPIDVLPTVSLGAAAIASKPVRFDLQVHASQWSDDELEQRSLAISEIDAVVDALLDYELREGRFSSSEYILASLVAMCTCVDDARRANRLRDWCLAEREWSALSASPAVGDNVRGEVASAASNAAERLVDSLEQLDLADSVVAVRFRQLASRAARLNGQPQRAAMHATVAYEQALGLGFDPVRLSRIAADAMTAMRRVGDVAGAYRVANHSMWDGNVAVDSHPFAEERLLTLLDMGLVDEAVKNLDVIDDGLAQWRDNSESHLTSARFSEAAAKLIAAERFDDARGLAIRSVALLAISGADPSLAKDLAPALVQVCQAFSEAGKSSLALSLIESVCGTLDGKLMELQLPAVYEARIDLAIAAGSQDRAREYLGSYISKCSQFTDAATKGNGLGTRPTPGFAEARLPLIGPLIGMEGNGFNIDGR